MNKPSDTRLFANRRHEVGHLGRQLPGPCDDPAFNEPEGASQLLPLMRAFTSLFVKAT